MKNSLREEMVVIENELHRVISLIEEASYPQEEKKQMKEAAFKTFLERQRENQGCSSFKTMTVDELKEIYEQFRNQSKNQKER